MRVLTLDGAGQKEVTIAEFDVRIWRHVMGYTHELCISRRGHEQYKSWPTMCHGPISSDFVGRLLVNEVEGIGEVTVITEGTLLHFDVEICNRVRNRTIRFTYSGE